LLVGLLKVIEAGTKILLVEIDYLVGLGDRVDFYRVVVKGRVGPVGVEVIVLVRDWRLKTKVGIPTVTIGCLSQSLYS